MMLYDYEYMNAFISYKALKKLIKEDIFVFNLESELHKCYKFYTKKYIDLTDKMTELLSKDIKLIPVNEMKNTTKKLLNDTELLINFLLINKIAIRKILKKYDKINNTNLIDSYSQKQEEFPILKEYNDICRFYQKVTKLKEMRKNNNYEDIDNWSKDIQNQDNSIDKKLKYFLNYKIKGNNNLNPIAKELMMSIVYHKKIDT